MTLNYSIRFVSRWFVMSGFLNQLLFQLVGKIWTLMQPMLSLSFRQRVHILDHHDLHNFLKEDFLQLLPDDIPGGTVHTEKLVRDYVAFHLALDERTHPRGVAAMIPLPIGRRRKIDHVLDV